MSTFMEAAKASANASISQATSLIPSSSSLEKARLIVRSERGLRVGAYDWAKKSGGTYTVLHCQFNPTNLTISKEVSWNVKGDDDNPETEDSWEQVYDAATTKSGSRGSMKWKYKGKKHKGIGNRNTPGLKFGGGKPATFGLDLFFDTSQESGADRDVRKYTNDLLALTLGKKDDAKPGEVKDPPKVLFVWGELVLFEAVVTKVDISYVLFDPDGKPIRATAKVGFTQHDEFDNEYQNPTTRTEPRKTWVVEQGDTVHLIATAEYGHPAHWRHVADSNNLLNPLALRPGQVLVLPPLV